MLLSHHLNADSRENGMNEPLLQKQKLQVTSVKTLHDLRVLLGFIAANLNIKWPMIYDEAVDDAAVTSLCDAWRSVLNGWGMGMKENDHSEPSALVRLQAILAYLQGKDPSGPAFIVSRCVTTPCSHATGAPNQRQRECS